MEPVEAKRKKIEFLAVSGYGILVKGRGVERSHEAVQGIDF